jgi:hypothetical protein
MTTITLSRSVGLNRMLREAGEELTRYAFSEKLEMDGIGGRAADRVIEFRFAEIPSTQFFRPSRPPNEEWVMSYGKSWNSAYDAAEERQRSDQSKAMREARRKHREYKSEDHILQRHIGWPRGMHISEWERDIFNLVRRMTCDAADCVSEENGESKEWRFPKWGAAVDAVMRANSIVASERRFKGWRAYCKLMDARWEVPSSGYHLYGDMNGTMYALARR